MNTTQISPAATEPASVSPAVTEPASLGRSESVCASSEPGTARLTLRPREIQPGSQEDTHTSQARVSAS
jgi:hypothetical protein